MNENAATTYTNKRAKGLRGTKLQKKVQTENDFSVQNKSQEKK